MLMVIFAKPISGWIRVQKLLQGIREQRFLKACILLKE